MARWHDALTSGAAERAARHELATVRVAEATRAPGSLGHAYVAFQKRLACSMSWSPELADLYCSLRLKFYQVNGTQADDGETFVQLAMKHILELNEEVHHAT